MTKNSLKGIFLQAFLTPLRRHRFWDIFTYAEHWVLFSFLPLTGTQNPILLSIMLKKPLSQK